MSHSIVIGADIGGSHITAAQIDVTGKQLIDTSLVRLHVDSLASAQEIINVWAGCIKQATQQQEISKVCLAMPGPFNYEEGICFISDQNKYPQLYGLNVKKMLADALEIDPAAIYINNDAACFLQGEVFYGSVNDGQVAISVTLGTGLGTAIYKNGRSASADLWNMPLHDGIAEEYLSTRWFVCRYAAISGSQISGVKELAGLAMHNELVRTLFNEFGNNLSIFLNRFIESSGAEAVVIGGNIAQSFPLFKEVLLTGISARFPKVLITTSVLGEEAALVGAVAMVNGEW
ncbi:ROK family protein [Niastella sp. OAS944]|uniref:ROK family protein n=1 Tax=Niastella sp. OAS944 TaxID=2664089 RepID=UPI0034967043|nr:glucokinase [Chitinophagaceae bacterium OAS944]